MSEIKEYTIQFCDKQDNAASIEIDAKDISEKVQSIDQGKYVIWMHHGVFVGSTSDFNFDVKYLQDYLIRIRAFIKDREWHIWRTGDVFRGRFREDKNALSQDDKMNNEKTPYVETSMMVRGVIVRELGSTDNNKNWYIKTRNYIDFNDIDQAGYVDSRFVQFIKK